MSHRRGSHPDAHPEENAMTTIKIANTTAGFAIGLLRGKSHRDGAVFFEVVRMDPRSKYVVLHRTGDPVKARELANREYFADKAA